MHLRNQIKRWLCDQVVEVDAGSSSPGETVKDVEDTFNLFRLVDWFLTQSSGSLGICGSVAIPSCAAQRIFWPKLSTAAWHHSTAALLRSCFRDLASLRRTRDRSEKKKHNFHQLSPWREAQCDTKYAKVTQKWFMWKVEMNQGLYVLFFSLCRSKKCLRSNGSIESIFLFVLYRDSEGIQCQSHAMCNSGLGPWICINCPLDSSGTLLVDPRTGPVDFGPHLESTLVQYPTMPAVCQSRDSTVSWCLMSKLVCVGLWQKLQVTDSHWQSLTVDSCPGCASITTFRRSWGERPTKRSTSKAKILEVHD